MLNPKKKNSYVVTFCQQYEATCGSKKMVVETETPFWFPDFFHQTFDGRPSTSSKWISTSPNDNGRGSRNVKASRGVKVATFFRGG